VVVVVEVPIETTVVAVAAVADDMAFATV